ncbi:6-phosphogluconolactonase [Aspergillus heteromorphus CBS 117.55]|uniref:6-phosphogluconolactonase n=1 Tax=Aspergillus heteromorphus CBS 117.55 TaxID=1448321 RepID=A0A317VD06_9EURO|nr:6-phosphogluconolactonase [Aspergillus heteromorphus CBS 117.55]PWY69760.1 6-phosphogluconolactonase [Aspergillus heteromorphus CBS 117.55]
MFLCFNHSVLACLAWLSLATATNLYATHYSGTVSTLSLDRDNNGSYLLSLASSLETCGSMPSWLTFDSTSRILYCSDETGDASIDGSVTSLAAGQDGTLTDITTATAPGGGVDSVIYNGDDGARYLAIAHYTGSAVSTFRLPLDSNSETLQVFHYNLSQPGQEPQQDAPHPHQVFLDPSGSFILAPDLGADLVRVYAINNTTGELDSHCSDLTFPAGSGPRHGLFWENSHPILTSQLKTRKQDDVFLYTVNELDGHLKAFTVSYTPDGCLSFKEIQSFVPYPEGQLPEGATLSEIRQAGDYLYVSIRTDHGFPPNDSIATLDRSSNGTVAFRDLTSSYGTVPRTLVINKAGDLVAVGDQASSNVAIVARDPASGELGEEVASLKIGDPGQVGTAQGLSSVVWDE